MLRKNAKVELIRGVPLGAPRTATVTTTKPSRMLVITARDFRSLLRRVPSIQLKVLEALASRLPHEYG